MFILGNRVEFSDRVPLLAVVFYDHTFPCSFIASPEQAASYFEAQGFIRANVQELESLMERAIQYRTAYKTIFVFINDIVPMNIAQVHGSTCTLGRYLTAGGRIVWWGDVPLHQRSLPGQTRVPFVGGPTILSVNHYIPTRQGENLPVLWERQDLNGNIRLTDEGRAIGMTTPGQCIRPAGVDQDTVVYSEITGDLGFSKSIEALNLRWAISWRKVFNASYPHSGFMQYPLGAVNCNDEAIVKDFFRFSIADWPFIFATEV